MYIMSKLITFRSFSNAITSIFSTDIKHISFVGRWNIPNTNSNDIINKIIDRNNEDHCGVCNDVNLHEESRNNDNNVYNKDDEYYKFFI